ncbi:GAS2-like protein 2 isoform X2 [Macaca mulatta]
MSQPAGGRRRPGTLKPPVCSIRPFKSSEQYLEAMKEDLAEWLRDLYGLDIDSTNFLQVLETGLVLCRHANAVTDAALAFLAEAPARAQKIPMPRVGVSCNAAAQPGTFQARDNVSNFIQWCRKEMGIQEVLMFETEDLVQRKNVKNVLLCLLELGRRAWRFGVAAPTLVQLEEEIEEEVRRELALPPPDPLPPAPPRRQPCHFRNLDQMILRNNVMVRVGGGWDTLGHYLDKHDPCRCTSLSHKPGNFLKPPAPPVQHEVRVQDGPSQTQPTMTISRSQSPPPPVDWKTYASSGRRLRSPTPSSPRPRRERGAGTGASREMAPFLRCQERSLTPSWRQPTAGDSPPSPQSSSSQKGRDPQCTLSGKRVDRYPPGLPRGRIPTSWVHEKTDSQGTDARNPTPQRLRDIEATTKGISARGLSPLPRSCSPAEQLGLRLPLQGKAKGAFFQFREPESVCSPTPVQDLTKIPIRLPSPHPPTPGRSFPGATSRSPGTELGRDPIPLRAVTADLAGSTHGDCSVKVRQEDQQLDIQLMAEAKVSRDLGPQEQEGQYTPLPLGRNKEQAIYCSLEEEILGNMKLLEVGSACLQGTRSGVIPRSGVYVPSLGGRWPEPGGPYDKVIQELAQGPPPLLKVDLEAWKAAPTGSPKPAVTPGPGSLKGKLGAIQSGPSTKASLSAKGTHMRKVPPQGGQNCSAPTASASPEAPTPLPLDPNSDKVKACLSEGRRTLRKPKKVPSIYKLKLRPRIRPRRDHRPEKQPSRIPKPLAYVCLGPARPPRRDRLLRAVLGSKGGEASRVDGASVGEEEEEGKEKEPAAPLESRPQTPEDLRPHWLDQAPLPPEEESWV